MLPKEKAKLAMSTSLIKYIYTKTLLFVYIFIACTFWINHSQAQQSDSIAAVVNSDVITYSDLYDRMNLIIQSSRMPNTKEFKERLLPQVLTGLITEHIQLQKSQTLNLPISDEEIQQGFDRLAQQNNMDAGQFKSILKQQKVNVATLYDQIESQLAWGKVIQADIRPRVVLSGSDIESEMNRLKAREGQEEYFVAEIFFPVGDNAPEADVRNAANDLYKQLKADPRKFPAAARQFSQNTTAAAGGVIGWITPDQLDDDISQALINMPKNSLSPPVKTNDGYTILLLRDKRKIDLGGTNSQERLRIKIANFTMPVNDNDRQQIQNEIDLFIRDVKGCLDINKRVAKLESASLQELDDVSSQIPANIVAAVVSSDIGDVGQIIENDTVVQIPMLCGREGGQGMANVERQVEERMGMQRIDILQKRYLRDLISEAYIERRL
jgi:peptidyl-prolyl cis-trans isomerase SurA